ncbi:carbohydrate ABC transporter permease [Streptomyces acidiscabies]|uniref:Carbohydrate ABC transporter permease n=1 Tax=Streptomyces acidiscabies TaxID=42234 RepID=A0AAP6B5S7_9ACTN|nr:carbohydrate ABC transporter permease [Streptomyces acidiscabies]MBP5941676.1 carbohydrate ABC transporter permease [Streptomyces sp. LBUM 1476]MBZ3913083.1 carbohydrate ABC transporter permease [Streptomyces acidiscabies]MDX2958570.1 carbohydrate ABC transporter permease [Streptomyces acidiscabies]MDX3020924.1 carbohydrate ABC transporter permease [Streptomyces acidiscabies]MDX3790047.1 carbohydrate ABC transporter permease [Streptomyces acidiscabies]
MTTAVSQTPASGAAKRRRLMPRWRDYGRPRELIVRYLLLLFVLAITIGPLVWQLLSSLKGAGEDVFGAGASLIPRHPTLNAYKQVFDQVPVWTYIRNSLIIVVLSVGSQLLFSTIAGYMLSKPGWKGSKLVWILLMASMMFPFESIMVSLFLSIRDLGLIDNLVGVWLPGFVGAINVLIMRAAFLAVPREIEDAAMLDGAGEWKRFRHLYLPSAYGAILVVAINTFISAWDDFLWPLIVLRTEDHFTLTLGLSRLQSSSFGYDQRLVMAGSVISVVPVLVLFVITQRWFYKGVSSGAVKL